MNMDVQYLNSPLALRIIFSEILHPMRLQSAVYQNGNQAQTAVERLREGASSFLADLYRFMQPGDESTTVWTRSHGH